MKIGADYQQNDSCRFVVWSVKTNKAAVKITEPFEKIIPMKKDEFDYWFAEADGIPAGARYCYMLNDNDEWPDPASHYQPHGVHSASEIVNHAAFNWTDNKWRGIDPKDLIIYELHIGTFTPEGTFEAAINKLNYLIDLGITAIEIMPVAQFSSDRNWGYDGCYPFAPQNSYGGPEGLKKLVNAAHDHGLAVILDVVYNHFGPEGSYAGQFSHYFTHKYQTPWGDAINYDDEYSDGVRNFFLENAKHWFMNYHLDGLRLDAIDTIYDLSAKHFLQELAEQTAELSKVTGVRRFLIAESDLNDIKIIKNISAGGYGINAQWNDNFHHSIHSLLTGETSGYYADFGQTEHLVTSLKESFYYSGRYSRYRKRRHGNSAAEMSPEHFIICLQNHDQVGNRAMGERLTRLVSFEALKAAAGLMLLSPYIPLLFMGEEYGEDNPFLYFVSHTDSDLVEAVQEGRRDEFKTFMWSDKIPDPFEYGTFEQSKLNWNLLSTDYHKILHQFYSGLIKMRKTHPALLDKSREGFIVSSPGDKVITYERQNAGQKIFVVFNFNDEAVTSLVNFPEGKWKKIFDSADEKWLGSGVSAPDEITGSLQNFTIKKESFSIYQMEII